MCWGRWSGLYICYFVWFQLISLSPLPSPERLSWHFQVSQDRCGLRCRICKGRDCSSKWSSPWRSGSGAGLWGSQLEWNWGLKLWNPHRQPGRRQLEVPSMLYKIGAPHHSLEVVIKLRLPNRNFMLSRKVDLILGSDGPWFESCLCPLLEKKIKPASAVSLPGCEMGVLTLQKEDNSRARASLCKRPWQ